MQADHRLVRARDKLKKQEQAARHRVGAPDATFRRDDLLITADRSVPEDDGAESYFLRCVDDQPHAYLAPGGVHLPRA